MPVTLDPTVLPNRVLQRMARLHQWLQDQSMSDSERTLACWLINRGDQGGHLDTRKSCRTIAEKGGGTSEMTVRRAVKKLQERGLLEVTPQGGRRGIRGTNHIRLAAPLDLLKVRFSDAELKAGADPLDVDYDLSEAGSVRSNVPTSSFNVNAPAHGSSEPSTGAFTSTEPTGTFKLNDEHSCREVEIEEIERQEGSAVKLNAPEQLTSSPHPDGPDFEPGYDLHPDDAVDLDHPDDPADLIDDPADDPGEPNLEAIAFLRPRRPRSKASDRQFKTADDVFAPPIARPAS